MANPFPAKNGMRGAIRKTALAFTLLALALGANAIAQERKAYRHVDEAGKVTYSQAPPVDGKEAKKVDISPAQRGRGGYTGGYSSYDDPRYYSNSSSYDRYSTVTRPGPSPRDRHIESLKAECERQRGTDCSNPRALQYLDSTSIPRRSRFY